MFPDLLLSQCTSTLLTPSFRRTSTHSLVPVSGPRLQSQFRLCLHVLPLLLYRRPWSTSDVEVICIDPLSSLIRPFLISGHGLRSPILLSKGLWGPYTLIWRTVIERESTTTRGSLFLLLISVFFCYFSLISIIVVFIFYRSVCFLYRRYFFCIVSSVLLCFFSYLVDCLSIMKTSFTPLQHFYSQEEFG